MICPVCGKKFDEKFAEGCDCGYSTNLLERIGSLMEYNGQRMTTHSSLILAVAIGIFSLNAVQNQIQTYIAILIFLVLSMLGLHLIERLRDVRAYNMVLEQHLRKPTHYIKKWKDMRQNNKNDILWDQFIGKETKTHKKNMSELKIKSYENKIKFSTRIVLASKYTKYFYGVFIVLVFVAYFL